MKSLQKSLLKQDAVSQQLIFVVENKTTELMKENRKHFISL